MKKAIGLISLIILLAFGNCAILLAANDSYDAEKEAAERIKRQLELASQLREQRLKKQREKEKRLEMEEKTRKNCGKIKDDLKKFSERRRWYQLDENGDRVFLSDKQVAERRNAIQNNYDKSCNDAL